MSSRGSVRAAIQIRLARVVLGSLYPICGQASVVQAFTLGTLLQEGFEAGSVPPIDWSLESTDSK